MRTAEEIARDAAEKAVTLQSGGGIVGVRVCVGQWVACVHHVASKARDDAACAAALLAPLFLAAVEEYARQGPVPSDLSDERLKEIEGWQKEIRETTPNNQWAPSWLAVRDLLAEVLFLRRLLADEAGAASVREAYARGERAGFARGALAQFEKDREEQAGRGHVFTVTDAPLATPPEGEG